MKLHGRKQYVTASTSQNKFNLLVYFTNLNITNLVQMVCYVQLGESSTKTIKNDRIIMIPKGRSGMFFFQNVTIPEEDSYTWKVQVYLTYDSYFRPHRFHSLPGSLFQVASPTGFSLPVANVSGQPYSGLRLPLWQVHAYLQSLPYVSSSDTYTLECPAPGVIYMQDFTPTTETSTKGPWRYGTTLNLSQKYTDYAVSGLVTQLPGPVASFALSSEVLSITSNLLPYHPAGIFPTPSSDSIHTYDPNPDSFSAVQFQLDVNLHPEYSPSVVFSIPMDNPILGYFFDNSVLVVALDEAANDPMAWKGTDGYGGYVSSLGVYQRCAFHPLLTNWVISAQIRVVGFALDGFPIVAPFLAYRNDQWKLLTTSDLDECHGLPQTITFKFKNQTLTYSYFYVCTFDFPYVLSAFRANPALIPV